MYEMKFVIEGIVHAMMDKFPLPTKEGKLPPKVVKGKEGDTKKILESLAYKDKKGMYIPADNIRMMLIGNKKRTGAATIYGQTVESKKGKERRELCNACVWVYSPDEKCRDKIYFEPIRKTWDDVDVRSIMINDKGQRDYVIRPLIAPPWSLMFIVQVTENTIDPDLIRAFYDIAGLRCGVGAYGPKFGRFLVKESEVIK